jgi:Flp pilus assembly CpaF family ATPase
MSDVGLDQAAVGRQIGSALDLIVHMARRPDGRRVLNEVASIHCGSSGDVELECLFSGQAALEEKTV